MAYWILLFLLLMTIQAQAQDISDVNLQSPLVTPYYNIVSFHGDPTAQNDSLLALESAMAAACTARSGGAKVVLPAGKYYFSAPLPASATWCNGLDITGAGRQTELDFPNGTGFAITEASGTSLSNNVRNLTIENLLIVIGGGSNGSNNTIGGISIGNYAFNHTYRNLYIVGPTTSTTQGISTSGDTYVSQIDLENVRIDNFGGTGGFAFYFSVSGTGDFLRCVLCYSDGAYIGIYVSSFWTALVESSGVDTSKLVGFYFQPANGGSITGRGLSGEQNQGDTFRIYGNSTGTVGGSVELDNPKSSASASQAASQYPINILNFAGDATIINPVSVNTVGQSPASFNISGGTPTSVIVMGCAHMLDKGFSAAASSFLKTQGNATCSN